MREGGVHTVNSLPEDIGKALNLKLLKKNLYTKSKTCSEAQNKSLKFLALGEVTVKCRASKLRGFHIIDLRKWRKL